MQNYNNLPIGLRVQTQIPLNAKENILDEASLKNLGLNNNLAYTYEKGLIVYCKLEGTRYEWREVLFGEAFTGLLDIDFIYPSGIITDDVDYSNKVYNFFEVLTSGQNGTQGPIGLTGPQGLQGPQGLPGINGSNGSNGLNGSTGPQGPIGPVGASGVDGTDGINGIDGAQGIQGIQGIQGEPGINGVIETYQKVITYPIDFTGTNYTLTNTDNNYEIIVDNETINVTITVPSGLTSKIGIGFTQKGTGDVSYVASGTTINNPIGLKIKGQYYQTYLSQELNTNIYYLGGNTKI